MNRILFSIFSLLLSLTVTANTPIIIDSDLGPDDSQAIIYLLSQPHIQVRAITIAADGETHCKPGLQNLSNLLTYLGHPNIPIACGPSTPLEGNHSFPILWRRQADHFFNIPLTHVKIANTNKQNFAPNLIYQIIKKSSDKITIIELAPVTNIALFINKHPKLAFKKISKIYITGLNINNYIQTWKTNKSFGLKNSYSWNTWVDPKASGILIKSGIPQYYANLSSLISLFPNFSFNWKNLLSPQQRLIQKIINSYGGKNTYIADQFTATWFINPTLCQPSRHQIKIIQFGKPHPGLSIISKNGSFVWLCKSSNNSHFNAFFSKGIPKIHHPSKAK